jgi:hypothetical protein
MTGQVTIIGIHIFHVKGRLKFSSEILAPTPFLYSGYKNIFPQGVKRSGRKADHLSTSAEVKNSEFIPTFAICLHGIVINFA